MKPDRFLVSLFLLLGSVIVLFLLVPLGKLLLSVGVIKVAETIVQPEVYQSIGLTLRTAGYAVLFVALTGIPLAYLIARHDFWGKSLFEALLDIPVMVPHTAAGIALLVAYNGGYVGTMLDTVGLGFIDTTTGIMAAMMFLSAPFLINGAKEGFRKVDPRLERVARTLGAGPLRTFWSIALPNARGEIVNGALMMWSRALGEFGAVVIIAYHPMVAPVLIYDRFNNFGLSYSAPVAAAMILVSVVLFLAVRWVNNRYR